MRAARDANQFIRERSRRKRASARQRIDDALSHTDDEAFLGLAWAVDALQSPRVTVATRLIQYPPDAATTDLTSKLHIHKWEIETLVNELLAIPKRPLVVGPNVSLNCQVFGAMAHMANQLRHLENAESGITLQCMSVLIEMHRISQRQFEWQRGFVNAAQIYRWAYIFGGPVCGEYFKGCHGLSVADFMLAGFALFSGLASHPVFNRLADLSAVGVDAATRDAALALVTATHPEARDYASKIRVPSLGVAYVASVLRQKPIIVFDERLRAPLPVLVIVRATAGIYYDVVSGPSNVRNEIGKRFEDYSRDMLSSLVGLKVKPSYDYRVGTNNVETPDLLLLRAGEPTIPVECKAKKMTIQARFGEDPVAEAVEGYGEIAKGVFQLWRFFSHARRGLHAEAVQHAPAGIVLTLDSWLSMATTLRKEVMDRAEILAARDTEITADDRKPVIFCSIEDLELALAEANAFTFVQAVTAAASDPEYDGWALHTVLNKVADYEIENPYQFKERIGEVLPWWGDLEARKKGSQVRD